MNDLQNNCIICGSTDVRKIKECTSKHENFLIGLCFLHKDYSNSYIASIIGKNFSIKDKKS